MKRILLLFVLLAAHRAFALNGGTNISVQNGQIAITGQIALANGGTGLSTAADDTTLVSSGAAWVATALPNCTDTGGNHLNYTTATNAFSCGTSGTVVNLVGFGTGMDVTTSQTCFVGAGTGIDCQTAATAEAIVQQISPGATYKNLRCINAAIQGTSNNIVITGRVGACGSQADGSLTCTITGTTGANQSCSDTTNSLAPTANQCFDLKIVTPATLTANARVNCVVERTA